MVLGHVALAKFLDAYPEPAFVLCVNTAPHPSTNLVYGNPALHTLLFGHDDSATITTSEFFAVLAVDDDFVWLSNPLSSGSSHTIGLRPAWLPRDHTLIDIELTATPIDLPLTISDVMSSSKSYVFTASPRKAPMNLLRSEAHGESGLKRRLDPSLRLPDLPMPSAHISVGNRFNSKSTSTSHVSHTGPVVISAEMPSQMIHSFPWENTSLGPRASWPTELELMVKLMMEKPLASSIFWGWPELAIIYNDSYARMIGSKHPGIFGKDGVAAWGEVWDDFKPIAQRVRQGKATAKIDDQLFFSSLTEAQLPEEGYYSWHWTPIWMQDGTVGGIWNSAYEVTQKVLAERRLAGVSDLLSRLSDATSQEQFFERTLEVLSKNELDLPIIGLYRCKVEQSATPSRIKNLPGSYVRNYSSALIKAKLTLIGSVGIPNDHPLVPVEIQYTLDPLTHHPVQVMSDPGNSSARGSPDAPTPVGTTSRSPATITDPASRSSAATVGPLSRSSAAAAGQTSRSLVTITEQNQSSPASEPDTRIDFTKVFVSGAIEIIDPLSPFLAQGLDGRGFRDTQRAVALLPIGINAGKSEREYEKRFPHVVLLVGLNTRREYDADYSAWLESVCVALSNQLAVVLQREADAQMMVERQRMDKAKTLFFTNVSHELRTPLTLIQAPLDELAASSSLNHDAKYKLSLAIRNGRRLKKLIDSIMDMSKLEAGHLTGRFQPVQLGQLTADLAALFRSMTKKKGVAYDIFAEEGQEPAVYVDLDLWEKIVCNLLSNAFKYTQKGRVTLRVIHDHVNSRSHVTVSDTGIGISKEYIEQIFERFFRVNNSATEGTGVGLALTKELVTLHGGTMSVESKTEDEHPGHSGTTFTVTLQHGSAHLPSSLVHETGPSRSGVWKQRADYWVELGPNTPSGASGDDEDSNAASSTLFFEKDDTILVADDNADMRSYLHKIFSPYLSVLEAQDGHEALQIASTQKLHLILCDVMMPGMSGSEFLDRLRAERRTMYVPLIFVTASDDSSFFAGNVEGAVDCVTKPFRVRDLLARAHLQLQIGKRRVKLEEDFEARAHELQVLTDLSPVGIFRTDPTGRLTYLNSTWHHVTGFPSEGDLDEWLDFIHPESAENMLQIWRECFAYHKSSSIRIQWKSERWCYFGISPLMSPEGTIVGAFGAITDITDQHRAEEARISLAEEREQVAASRAADAEAQRLVEVERRTSQELLIDVTSHELRQPVSAIIQNAEVVRTNMRALRKLLTDCRNRNISYAPTEKILDELEDDLQAMDSITQCGLAQARIANDVLSLSRVQLNVLSIIPTEFNVRHEMNQILTVFKNELATKTIELHLDLGGDTNVFGPQTVSTDRSRFGQIITNLMSNAVRFTDMSTDRRQIKVSLKLSPHPPSDETCEPPQSPPEGIPLVRSPPSTPEDTPVYIYVSVQDSGPGLQKEDLALLFQRQRIDSSKDPAQNAHHVFGGSGLGLYVCRQLCALMGGRVEVVNELDGGATFRFFIRATVPPNPRKSPVPTPGLQAEQSNLTQPRSSASTQPESRSLLETPNLHHNRPLNILITEDNKINQTVLARQMKRAGFTYSLTSNGLEAVEAIEKAETLATSGAGSGRYDVVLMDLEMPVMDGFTATREIRRQEAEGILRTRNFIIALTGNARREQVEGARDSGVDDVMIKPYPIETLISKMRAGPQTVNPE